MSSSEIIYSKKNVLRILTFLALFNVVFFQNFQINSSYTRKQESDLDLSHQVKLVEKEIDITQKSLNGSYSNLTYKRDLANAGSVVDDQEPVTIKLKRANVIKSDRSVRKIQNIKNEKSSKKSKVKNSKKKRSPRSVKKH